MCGDDAAVLHVADEDLDSGRKICDEAAKIVELTTDTGAEAIVDEDGDLGSAGRDRGDAGERSWLVVDFEGNVVCGESGWGLGVDCY